MAKFKKGDRVRITITDEDGCYRAGQVGTISKTDGTDRPRVMLDVGDMWVHNREMELIEDTKDE